MVQSVHVHRTALRSRAGANRRPDREAPAESDESVRGLSRPDARRSAGRNRAACLRRQDSVQRRKPRAHSRAQALLRFGARFDRQPSAERETSSRLRRKARRKEREARKMNHSRRETAVTILRWVLGLVLLVESL